MRRILIPLVIIAAVPLTAHAASVQVDPSSGWIVACGFSHRAMDDPIVRPGMPGMSHSHDFFGNDTTDADSTVASLLEQSTSCSLSADTAAYWVPTLYKNDQEVTPTKIAAYYRTQVDGGAVVQAFPSGLKLIAGDPDATGPQPTKNVYYNCHDGPDQHRAALPYDCGTHTIDAHVRFPQCWDGVHLDSADHRSHLAYPVYDHGVRSCPASYPVVVPRLIIRVSWPITNGNNVRLASGPAYTLHADYFDAWDRSAQADLVDRCINAGINCGKVTDPAS